MFVIITSKRKIRGKNTFSSSKRGNPIAVREDAIIAENPFPCMAVP